MPIPRTWTVEQQLNKSKEGVVSKSKTFDARVKLLYEYSRHEIIEPLFVLWEIVLADALTKALNATKMMKMCNLIGLM